MSRKPLSQLPPHIKELVVAGDSATLSQIQHNRRKKRLAEKARHDAAESRKLNWTKDPALNSPKRIAEAQARLPYKDD